MSRKISSLKPLSSEHSEVANHHVVNKAISIAQNLHVLLESEREIMKSRDEAAVRSLAMEKRHLLVELESLGSEIQNIASETVLSGKEEVSLKMSKQRLREILINCQNINRDNQAIASVEIKQSRDALELLRSLMKMNDVAVYSEAGEMTVTREKRYLGKF